MRVLIFSLAYEPLVGGAEIAVKEITNRISPTEIEFDLITKRFDQSHLAKERIGNVNIYRIDTSKNSFPFKALSLASRLHKENPYDAIWAIMANWAGFAALFFKWRHPEVKYILTLQEGDSLEYIEKKVRWVRPLWRKIFERADKVQAISTFLANWARRVGFKGEVEVIPNGVDFKKFENPTTRSLGEKVVLITTSRLVAKNGVGDVIKAMKFLPQSFLFKILGTGVLERELKQIAEESGLENRVEFVGLIKQEEIPNYLHQADIFVRPSLSEGMGNSFIEAMAAGLPVIATPVGGIADFLIEGETGVFCEPNNPESIAQAVKRLVENQELREKIKSQALEMVKEKYDWDLIAREMKSRVFESL